jgi:hypothetical protein
MKKGQGTRERFPIIGKTYSIIKLQRQNRDKDRGKTANLHMKD